MTDQQPRIPAESIASLFQPSCVAVVGASPSDLTRRRIVENFAAIEYPGAVFAVNPAYESVAGVPCYPNIQSLPQSPDALVIAVRAERVIGVLEDAAASGARSAIVFTGGFADYNEAGRELQERLVSVSREAQIALLGPNCQGVIDFTSRSAQYLLALERDYESGSVALISESGSVTDALANNTRGVRWSHVISSGNEACVEAADLLAHVLGNDQCKAVCLFLETIRSPEFFIQQCDRARALGKTLIVLKSGRTEGARAAAAAHTGALAGYDRLTDAIFDRHGVVRVNNFEEMLAVAAIAQTGRIPKTGRASVVLGSGGLVELLHDACAGTAVEFPSFADSTVSRLDPLLGPMIRRANPLDYWPTENIAEAFPGIVSALVGEPGTDVVVDLTQFEMSPTGSGDAGEPPGLSALIAAAALTNKTLISASPIGGAVSTDTVRRAELNGVAVTTGLDATVRAIDLLSRARRRSEPSGTSRASLSLGLSQISAFRNLGTRPISGEPALGFIASCGIRVADFALASTEDAAVKAARDLGYPVVVKAGDPEVIHKTEIDGVYLGLGGDDAVRVATAALLEGGTRTVLVQRQVQGGVEMIAGLKRDTQFGTFLLVGLGGVWTEYLDDVSVRPVGITFADAMDMLTSLRGAPLLTGARGRRGVDLDSVANAMLSIDAIGRACEDQLEAIDINPLIATHSGATAVDALISPSKVRERSEVAPSHDGSH